MEETKEETNNLKMSIQVRLNGLSFCIINSWDQSIKWYKNVNFEKVYDPVKLLEQIIQLYKEEKNLQDPVDQVVLLFSNELYSIVPQDFFKEEEASNYLKFSTKILKTDVVAHDIMEETGLVNVYIPFTNITNFFFEKYGEFEYKHSTSVLIQSALNYSHTHETTVFLNNFSGYYDLVVVKNGQLLLSNTFSYETKEDFIYYLLFTAEQLKLDPSQFHLKLLGDIGDTSAHYKMAYTYVKNIELFNPEIKISPAQFRKPQFQREAYLLLKSLECE